MGQTRFASLAPRACRLGLVLLVAAPAAWAVDVPLFGKRLDVRRSTHGRETMNFSGTAASLPLPPAAGPADPVTASTGGAFVDVVSSGASPVGAFVVPWGAEVQHAPGWSWSRRGDTLRYKNRTAPNGPSVVKALAIRRDRSVTIMASRTGLRLAGGEGTVGVRLTLGAGTADEMRVCAQFDPSTVRTDVAGHFAARNAAVTLADCSDAALGTRPGLDAFPLTKAVCGPSFNGVGNSTGPGVDLHRVTLHDAEARCNDGSPAVFYIRAANPGGGHENDWLMWLEGGGHCADPADCAARWCGVGGQAGYGAAKMSSRWTYPAIKGNGIFRQQADNRFKDFNMVVTLYCSSDNYVGRDTLDIEPSGLTPGYKVEFHGQAILQAMLRRLREGVTSDDGLITLPPIDRTARLLFTGTSGGGQGATYNLNRVAAWATAIPLADFKASIDARVVATIDDTTLLSDAQKEASLVRGAAVAAFRNDLVDERCLAYHTADPRICTDSSHLLLHHVTQTFFIRQDVADSNIGPAQYPTMEAFTTAERTYLSTQFRQRTTVAEEAAVRALPLPAVFAPRCGVHVGLESSSFYDDAVRVPPAPFTNYDENLWLWWSGLATPALIDGIGGAVTDLAHCSG